MNISAKIIADSIAENGKRLTTFELVYPRFIHSEVMTHRMFSKNAASSRAIPIEKMIENVIENTAVPVSWGKNQSGMQAEKELDPTEIEACKIVWLSARDAAIKYARQLSSIGLHKQICNRILEPFSTIKVVFSGTEYDNLFHLRRHKDAQPEFRDLADKMYEEYICSIPKKLKLNEWHLPYISDEERERYSTDDCLKISASLCAQVSYRKSDESLEKALIVYDRLVNSKPVHASPFEHQATPLNSAEERSGNFNGWHQFRQMIPHNVCHKYLHEDT